MDLALVLDVESSGDVEVRVGDTTWHYEAGEFLEAFAPAADGAEVRQSEIASLMAEINEAELETLRFEQSLASFNPHVSDSGEFEGSGTQIVPTSDKGVAGAKRQLGQVRNQIMRARQELAHKQKRLQMILDEQRALIEAKARKWEVMLNCTGAVAAFRGESQDTNPYRGKGYANAWARGHEDYHRGTVSVRQKVRDG